VPRHLSCKLCLPDTALLQLHQPMSHHQMQRCMRFGAQGHFLRSVLAAEAVQPVCTSLNAAVLVIGCSSAWCPGGCPSSCACLLPHCCRLIGLLQLLALLVFGVMWPAVLDYCVFLLDCSWSDLAAGKAPHHMVFAAQSEHAMLLEELAADIAGAYSVSSLQWWQQCASQKLLGNAAAAWTRAWRQRCCYCIRRSQCVAALLLVPVQAALQCRTWHICSLQQPCASCWLAWCCSW
jgi:hypothetical protein